MKSKIKYNKKIADSFHDTRYYECIAEDIKNTEFMENERKRLGTGKRKDVSDIITEKRNFKVVNIFRAFLGIYLKNKILVEKSNDIDICVKNSDLLNIVASPEMLINSYARIRKNKGATTLAHTMKEEDLKDLDKIQKEILIELENGVDGINIDTFEITSKLLKKGKYPWGASRRIYIDKPGKPGAKRPITIPPFMDRVVQDSIRNMLMAIYEPVFDKMNCSFGFRPNRGVHDAIYSLTHKYNDGLFMALEGDIKSAYDKVNRKKLIEILGKRITDRKFLKMIETRLDYIFYDQEKGEYIKDTEGIPQGGTDSPYLWNIYMLEFDVFILTEIKEQIEKTNIKVRGKNSEKIFFENRERRRKSLLKSSINKVRNWLMEDKDKENKIKEKIELLKSTPLQKWKAINKDFTGELKGGIKSFLISLPPDIKGKEILKIMQKKTKRISHEIINMPTYDLNKKKLRIIYARYADDWIILGNIKEDIMKKIKIKVAIFLETKLHAILSEEKTLITNLRKKHAHFLGFEISIRRNRKIVRYKTKINKKDKIVKANVAGNKMVAGVDRQRLLDRLHMKGYCDKRGFPREISRLANLEVFTIIEKTNSVLRGLGNFYANSIKNPSSGLNRWMYIIRFSCLKTIAQKHQSSISKIFKKFGVYQKGKGVKTIEETVIIEVNGIKYQKSWKLLTLQDILNSRWSAKAQKYRKEIEERYWRLRKGEPIQTEKEEKEDSKILFFNPKYFEKMNWTNIRTRASLDLPCSICGSQEKIEMHHVKHVRKTKYGSYENQTWKQIMGLRNRRQIPVCRDCHMNIIHAGKYQGSPLNYISKMYDNRIINIESYIHKGDQNTNYKKSLIQKGWTVVGEKRKRLIPEKNKRKYFNY